MQGRDDRWRSSSFHRDTGFIRKGRLRAALLVLAVLFWTVMLWATWQALAAAAPVGGFAVEELRLGDSLDSARARFPYLRVETVPYLDPLVGDRYRFLHGGVAAAEHVGRHDAAEGDGLLVVTARFTGDERLYAITTRRERDGLDCAREYAAAARQYGAADDATKAPGYALWIEQGFGVDRVLEFYCIAGEAVEIDLRDRREPQAFLRRLADELAPIVRETLTTVQ
ncbi:MAG: hypothetical protein ACTS3R_16145 [Inquilinaceae bacterium]